MSPPPSWLWAVFAVLAVLGLFVAGLPWVLRPMLRALLCLRYGCRTMGLEHVPRTGPVLVASNHVTWIDGVFLFVVLPRRTHALVNADYLTNPVLGWLAHRIGIIPLPWKGPRAQRQAIEAVRRELDRGELVLIFPEAQLTRTGLLGPFYRGLEVMLKDRDHVPIVPVFLDNLWGSIFSFSDGRTFRKCPIGLRRKVVIAFGPPVGPHRDTFSVRQAVLVASVHAFAARNGSGRRLETIDLSLPHWEDPRLGLLTVSTADFHHDDIHQLGQKPNTVGQTAPGVALQVVDDQGQVLGANQKGHIQALLPNQEKWLDTGKRGQIDRDGFVSLESPP